MKYKYRFFSLFLLVCLCGYLFFVFYEEAKKTAIQELNARQMLYAKQAAKEIERFFVSWIGRLTYFSENEAIISLNELGKKEMTFFHVTHKDDIKGITRVDARGKIIYTVPYVKKSIGADISYQKHIREIMRIHKPVVSDVFHAAQGFDAIALHVPVFRKGRYDGTVGILIDFQSLAKRYLEDIKIRKTGYAWLVSQGGTELYCPVPGHTGKSVFENCKDFPTIIAMAREMLKGNQGVTTYFFDMVMGQSVQTVKKHAVYMPIRIVNTFWSIVVASSEDELLASLKDFRNRLLIIVGMLILIGTVFSYYSMKAWGVVQEEKKRKMAEVELRESERRLADIINFLPDAILVIDLEGRIIVWNKAIEEMTGFPAETMLGRGDYEYAIPFYGIRRPLLINFIFMWDQGIEKQYSFIKKEGDTLFTETSVPFVQGHNRILWAKASPLYNTEGNVVGAIESIRDVTERREAEKALFNEKERLLILSENAPFGMVLIGKNGRFLYVNPKFRGIFGYDLNDIPDGKTWFRKAYPDPAYRRDIISTWLDDLNNARYGEQRSRVFNATCKDGSIKTFNFITVLLGNGDNIMVCEDITERKRLETQLMNAQKMEAIGTLSGGIAHDFNNILMSIQGYTSLMMLDISTDHPHYEKLKRIEGQVKSAADLTRQLLGFARGGKYVVKPVNMNELIEKTSTMFGRTKKEVAIHSKYEMGIWAVEADQGQIEQVFLNLYLNAWQAMPTGGDLSLETQNIVVDENYTKAYSLMPGRYVRISISDTGTGMDEKTKERIFEPFFTTKELGRGTGLGLAMVYGIIKNHNGSIDVISKPGHGTTFTLYLPASEKKVIKEKPGATDLFSGSETILLVDDEPSVLAVSKEILESLGYTVHGKSSGQEAIAFYKENKDDISLIILDMIMPGLSGGETFNRIRELDPSVIIILSSGYSFNDQAQQIMNKGCQGFIQKPFDIAHLSRKIREVLDR
jgi:PAS domain S-box-containing protein